MDGYAKMSVKKHTKKSRSIDFSDLISKPISTNTKPIKTHIPELTEDQELDDHDQEEATKNDMDNKNNINGQEIVTNKFSSGENETVLKRSSSVSSSSISSSIKAANIGLKQKIVGFSSFSSMRRSSSVAERYCRIHDQSSSSSPVIITSNAIGCDDNKMETGTIKKKNTTTDPISSTWRERRFRAFDLHFYKYQLFI